MFERTRPSGLDDLIRVFGQSSQYKGLSGLAPAYTSNQERKRSEELALERRQNELLRNLLPLLKNHIKTAYLPTPKPWLTWLAWISVVWMRLQIA
jgi:hypothetical protein